MLRRETSRPATAYPKKPIPIPQSTTDQFADQPTIASTATTILENGTTLLDGKYVIQGYCGGGSFGDVYKVLDVALKKVVAAKILRKRKRPPKHLLKEAEKAAKLRHENIAQVFSAGIDNKKRTIIVFEYIDGYTLDRAEQDLDIPSKLRIVSQVARALHYAHNAAQLFHRDVKLSNIMVAKDGTPKLVDFGLAEYDGSKESLLPAGTPPFMAPEMFDASLGDPGPLSDLYSLGVVLFRLLTGRLPFEQQVGTSLRSAICSEPAPNVRQFAPEIPNDLADICRKCLEKRPELRFQSGEELANALDQLALEFNSGSTLQNQLRTTYDTTQELLLQLMRRQDGAVEVVSPQSVHGLNYRTSSKVIDPLVRQPANSEQIGRQIAGAGNSTLAAVETLWPQLRFDHQVLLVLAAAFRRPRSVMAIQRLGVIILSLQEEEGSASALSVLGQLKQGTIDTGSSGAPEFEAEDSAPYLDVRRRFKQAMEDLNRAALVLRQEGGFYWMHTDVRDHIYHTCVKREPQGMGNLHEKIAAVYYETIFRASRDVQAFREFVAHQVMAIRLAATCQQALDRLEQLLCCLQREQSRLLAHAHPSLILGWIYTIRDQVLEQVSRTRWRHNNDGREERLAEVIREMRAFLCDVAGEVYRRTTNYLGCVDVRLEQITHRMSELQKPCPQGWLSQRKEELNSRNYESLKEHLLGQLSEACLYEHVPTQLAKVCERLLDHIYQIAVCLRGMHQHDVAKSLFTEIARLADGILQYRPAGSGFALASSARDAALTIRCRCSRRIMDAVSAQVYTWDDPERAKAVVNEIILEYAVAMGAVGMYPGRLDAVYSRHNCLLKTLVARAHFIQGRFEQANIVLDNARALVASGSGAPARMAHAECELRRAECAFLEADKHARNKVQPPKIRLARARECLGLAAASIRHARDLLKDERGSVWRWTLLFLEETQLRHEEIALTFLEENPLALDQQHARWRAAGRALHSLAAGLDNIHKDKRRWCLFETLWWQLYICVDFEVGRPWCGFAKEWLELNEDAGLRWFWTLQEAKWTNRIVELRKICDGRQFKPLLKKWQTNGASTDPDLRHWLIELERAAIG
jgi:serine/threonine-protein kinase